MAGEGRLRGFVQRLAAATVANFDGIVAVGLAGLFVLLSILDVLGVKSDPLSSATLAVLAFTTITVLRDRNQGKRNQDVTEQVGREVLAAEARLRGALGETTSALHDVARISVANGPEIGRLLADARRSTVFWNYRGGTGRGLRSGTLPECVDAARARQAEFAVRIELVDPRKDAACERYALLRNRSSPVQAGPGAEPWTKDRVRDEVLATLLATCWHLQRYPLLDARVALSATAGTMRWDQSSSMLLLRQGDRTAQAVVATAGSTLYGMAARELRISHEQARPVPVRQAADAVALDDRPNVRQVRALFQALDLTLPTSLGDDAVSRLVARALPAST
jgi:hypothetical protein